MPNWVWNTVSVEAKTKEEKEQFKSEVRHGEEAFSFMKLVPPPQEAIDSGEYHGVYGFDREKGEVGRTSNNWYVFNNREWGTKWDACEVEILDENDTSIVYQFMTAWSSPDPVFEAMVEKYPNLEFDFSWEEEQGWGGEAIGAGGHFSITNEWDIPDSHADYINRDRLDSCICYWHEDKSEWYDDCPKEEETK